MSETTTFQYSRFASLADDDLYAYVGPFISDQSAFIPLDALLRILTEMPTYDDGRLVFALELGAARRSDLLAPHIPKYLSHQSQSVRAAASRALSRLANAYVTDELLMSVYEALSSCPEGRFLTYLVEELEEKLRRRKQAEEKGGG